MENASCLPQDARIVANPNEIDIYTIDRVQYQPRMVRPGDTASVSKKKPERRNLWAYLIVTIFFIFLFLITYNQNQEIEVGPCAGITGPKSTFLWTINAPHLTSTSYLFGTIHVPNLWNNVSSQAKNAFNNSDALALEFDLQDLEFIRKVQTCIKFSNETAIGLFPNKTDVRQKIKRMAGFFQMNVAKFEHPYGFNNLTNLTNKNPILDEVLNSMGKAEGKPVISVETADEVCERLKFSEEIEIASISLDEKLENIIEDYQKNQYPYSLLPKKWRSKRSINDHMSPKEDEKERLLVKTYACNILNKKNFIDREGMIQQINAQIIEIQSSRTRNLYERGIANQIVGICKAKINLIERFVEGMLTKRNIIMSKRIDEMLRKNPNTKYFIAFGVDSYHSSQHDSFTKLDEDDDNEVSIQNHENISTTTCLIAQKLSEIEQVSYVKTVYLIKRYFKVVIKTLQDSIPKTILRLLVYSANDKLHDDLIRDLYPHRVDELMADSPEMIAYKENVMSMTEVMKEAISKVQKIRDPIE